MKVQYDVVMSCYTLGDLPSINIRKLSLTALWRKTKSYLVHNKAQSVNVG